MNPFLQLWLQPLVGALVWGVVAKPSMLAPSAISCPSQLRRGRPSPLGMACHPPPPPPPMLFALLPLCIPWSPDAGHPLTPSDGPHRPLKCPWHPRMKAGHAWGEAWPGQSLEACGRVFRGNGKGLVSQEEGGGHQEILQIQSVWAAPQGQGRWSESRWSPREHAWR